jgi:hypothetical protein
VVEVSDRDLGPRPADRAGEDLRLSGRFLLVPDRLEVGLIGTAYRALPVFGKIFRLRAGFDPGEGVSTPGVIKIRQETPGFNRGRNAVCLSQYTVVFSR